MDPAKRAESTASTQPSVTETAASSETAVAVTVPQGGDLFSQGVALFNSKQYTEAYKTFETVLSQNPRGEQAADKQRGE